MNEKKPFKPGEQEQKQPKYEPEIKHSDQDFEKRDDKQNERYKPIFEPKPGDDK